jgi:hypothetical protein
MYSTVNSIFHISIRINCNWISWCLLYLYLAGWCSSNTVGWCLGGGWFKSYLGHQLSWLTFLWFYLAPLGKGWDNTTTSSFQILSHSVLYSVAAGCHKITEPKKRNTCICSYDHETSQFNRIPLVPVCMPHGFALPLTGSPICLAVVRVVKSRNLLTYCV